MDGLEKNVRIVKLKGGLGNQLFQYAFGALLNKETGDKVLYDVSVYKKMNPLILQLIDISIAEENEIYNMMLFPNTMEFGTFSYKLHVALEAVFNREYYYEYDRKKRDVGRILKYKYFDGYWQSYSYVNEIIDNVRKNIHIKDTLSSTGQRYKDSITTSNSVSVGFRRGDYLTTKPKHYGNLGMEYYLKAMDYLSKQINNPVFWIFSDDIEWVKRNNSFEGYNVNYVEGDMNDLEEFILMINCKHAIIPNSTFHWWGAKMFEYTNKIVVAPKHWFNDGKDISIVCDNWIRL